MKKSNSLMTIISILIVILITLSCSTSKKTAMNCPVLPRSNSNPRASLNLKKHDKKILAYSQSNFKRRQHAQNRDLYGKKENGIKGNPSTEVDIKKSNSDAVFLEKVSILDKVEFSKYLTASVDNSLIPVERRSQSIISSVNQVASENVNEVKNRNNILSNPRMNLINRLEEKKNAVSSIFTSALSQESSPKVEGLGLAGFVSSLVGLLVAAIPLGTIAIIFGAISLGKINKHPDKFKGKGFAITSLVVGIVDVVVGIILVAAII